MSTPANQTPILAAPSSLGTPSTSAAGLLVSSLVLTTLAGGMAWGIRGQYGHETGAMIFGVLAGFVIVLLYLPQATALQAARTIALFTLAIGFGGSMTYGQTVGLTMNAAIHGNAAQPHWNAAAYQWGMLGLAIKGGLWIGFGGLFLGMGLSGKRYYPQEMLGIGLVMLAIFYLGRWTLNMPFDPEHRQLPSIYFSADWRWEATDNLQPRREVWGGLLFAFLGLLSYLAIVKRDCLALNLGLWGILGGLGFPVGQSFQAAAAWDPAAFARNSWWQIGVNTWNTMEVTFGMAAGFCLALGTWVNRHRISQDGTTDTDTLSPSHEGWLIGFYVSCLLAGWYFENSVFGVFYHNGLLLGLVPMIASVGGRYAPFLYVFPIVALSILVKTYLQVFPNAGYMGASVGLIFLVTIPLALLIWLAIHFGNIARTDMKARSFASVGLLVTAILYFWMNFTFFAFPWHWWTDWKGLVAQHNSGGIYIVSWLVLSSVALRLYWRSRSAATLPVPEH